MTDQDPEAWKLDLERKRLELDDAFRREELEEKRAPARVPPPGRPRARRR